jgi:hypothetical protein
MKMAWINLGLMGAIRDAGMETVDVRELLTR